MVDDKEPSIFKRVFVPNGIISTIFLIIHNQIAPLLLGWETNTTFTILGFALFCAVTLLVDYFLYLRPYQRWKSAKVIS